MAVSKSSRSLNFVARSLLLSLLTFRIDTGERDRTMNQIPDSRLAEDLVAWALTRRGWNILAQNYRRRGTEIDIIGWKQKTLIFVEVKLRRAWPRSNTEFADLLPLKKQKALVLGSNAFCSESSSDLNLKWDTLRFDLAIVLKNGHVPKNWAVRYYPACFTSS